MNIILCIACFAAGFYGCSLYREYKRLRKQRMELEERLKSAQFFIELHKRESERLRAAIAEGIIHKIISAKRALDAAYVRACRELGEEPIKSIVGI